MLETKRVGERSREWVREAGSVREAYYATSQKKSSQSKNKNSPITSVPPPNPPPPTPVGVEGLLGPKL